MNSQLETLLYVVDKRGIASITLNRPHKHNAFDDTMIKELTDCFNRAAQDDAVRALILQASGNTFCAGADLHWMQRMANYTEEQNRQDALALSGMLQTLYTLPKPTIARVQGAAFGGAVGLIACCDIAVGSLLSKFCFSEARVGLIPATISPYVIKAIGERECRRYFQTAEVFSARRAKRFGLLSEAVTEEELGRCIENLLGHILANGPVAVRESKLLVQQVSGQPINRGLMDTTSQMIARIRVSNEGQEGLHAFFEKRPAQWQEPGA
ncbi:enoyl-CoA hydratase/isomerase family protein [Alteromonas aestuariivivens]|uniref:Enoyl-CoA hydratase/isomerase family protein n=1 Tax=Alteromonas aestuariivivens TaxID=1938339 RepID=A0A3D8MCR0_9ALTE|nr:enoyl-CoA hydratase/isomerase family protein [Alteromonas aestuariivivens]RDV27463.1 enoyl-CoA hydratase/isomerase family protein [Alteromonas aestuariivivens]